MTVYEALARLRDAYPDYPLSERTAALYTEKLAGVPPDLLEGAVEWHIVNRTRFPSIAQLLRPAAERKLQLPDEDEAWRLANDQSTRAIPRPVIEARDYVGGRWALRTAENQATLRAQFRDAYGLARDRATQEEIRRLAGNAPALPAARAKQIEAGPAPVLVRDMNEPMRQLPETTRVMPRPVLKRWVSRQRGHALPPPSEAEKADAIRVLEAGPINGELDPLYREAESILHEAGK